MIMSSEGAMCKNQLDSCKALLKEFKLMRDNHDLWGEAMGLRFDIAAELFTRGENIPASWEYSPPMVIGDIREYDSYWYEILETMPVNALVKAGNILERYDAILRKHDLDY